MCSSALLDLILLGAVIGDLLPKEDSLLGVCKLQMDAANGDALIKGHDNPFALVVHDLKLIRIDSFVRARVSSVPPNILCDVQPGKTH